MKWKLVIGILLLAVSAGGMYLWETKYRDEITMQEVIVAARDISENEMVGSNDFTKLSINPEAVIEGALTESDIQSICGKLATQDLYKNQQLVSSDFMDEEDLSLKGSRHFVIPSEWIYTKSTTLSEKEYVRIYALPDKYDVEALTDTNVDFITDSAIEDACWENPENYYLGRYKLAVSQPEQEIEILATIDEYFKLYEAFDFSGKQLVIFAEDE